MQTNINDDNAGNDQNKNIHKLKRNFSKMQINNNTNYNYSSNINDTLISFQSKKLKLDSSEFSSSDIKPITFVNNLNLNANSIKSNIIAEEDVEMANITPSKMEIMQQ